MANGTLGRGRKRTLAFLQETACLFLRMAGLPWLVRNIVARTRVTIVNYHHPCPEVLERHLVFYKRHYSVISLDDLLLAYSSGNWSLLPAKSLVLTFDDGHRQNEMLFPILEQYDVAFTVYAVAGVVGTRRQFWFGIDGLAPNEKRRLKTLPNDERLQRLKLEHDFEQDAECAAASALSIHDLRHVTKLRGTVAAHSMFHAILPNCDDKTLRSEVFDARSILEQYMQKEIAHFAYPSGAWDQRVRDEVVRSDYRTARTTKAGWVTEASDVFTLPTMGISDNASLNKAIVQASGVWWFVKGLVRNMRHRFHCVCVKRRTGCHRIGTQ